MNNLFLSDINKMVKGQLLGSDKSVSSICMDTRKLQPGELFIALEGEQFNGHDFIPAAKEKGAVGVLVSKATNADLSAILVSDTRKALGLLAKEWRKRANIPFLAITGSCGKTTTKAMLASIMGQLGPVLASQSSFNNDIGLPITLLQLKPQHQFAVLELGTNHFGEIAYLTEIAKPDIALILNIGSAHLEYFGDTTGVARAKGEIFQSLQANGIAVINADDTFADYFRSLASQHQIITFGIHKQADVVGSNVTMDGEGYPSFDLMIKQQTIPIKLRTIGEHNVSNALGAAAVAYAAGASLEQIKVGLISTQPVVKRMVLRTGIHNVRIIDDTYNAAPNAVSAALETLAHMSGEKIFVFGGMAELGKHSEYEHIIVGEKARQLGINELYAIGPCSHLTINAFGVGGRFFANKIDLIAALKPKLHVNVTLLVKGSRGSKMEEIVAELVKRVP